MSVISYVDLPTAGATVTSGSFYVDGWGFECFDGSAADRVDVWYQNPSTGVYTSCGGAGNNGNGPLSFGLARPDVAAAYKAHCPPITPAVGWHFTCGFPIPIGTRNLAFNVWKGPFMQTHVRNVTLV